MVCIGCIYQGVRRMDTSLICLPVYHGGCTPPYMPSYLHTLGTPPYHAGLHCCTGPAQHCHGAKRGGPGLRTGITRGWEPSARLKVLILLGLEGHSAQSPSLSLRITDERLDSDRVTLPIYPMVEDLCAEWYPFRPSIRSWENVAQSGPLSSTRFTVG